MEGQGGEGGRRRKGYVEGIQIFTFNTLWGLMVGR